MGLAGAGEGFDVAGGLGFRFGAEPVFADVFFDDGGVILGAAGKIISFVVGNLVDVAFNDAVGAVGIFGLAAFGTKNSQLFGFGGVGDGFEVCGNGSLVVVVAGPAGGEHFPIDQSIADVNQGHGPAALVKNFFRVSPSMTPMTGMAEEEERRLTN